MNKEYYHRCFNLIKKMKENSVAIMYSSPSLDINLEDVCLYKQDSNLFYFTGYLNNFLLFIVTKDSNSSSKVVFFTKNKDKDLYYNFHKFNFFNNFINVFFYDWEKIEFYLPYFILNKNCIYYSYSNYLNNDLLFFKSCYDISNLYKNSYFPEKIINLNILTNSIRMIKSKLEIKILRKSAYISSLAHLRAMKYCKIGIYEYNLENEILHEFYSHKCVFSAFKSIVASGKNGRQLHYSDNNFLLEDNDMVLVDSGCNYQGYTSDITRTYPVNKKFNIYQKKVYNLVLEVFCECLSLLRPGSSFGIINDKVIRMISIGLINLKIISVNLSVNDFIKQKLYKNFYMHNIGHWIGIDVHDVYYKYSNKNDIIFEPNMVITIEPGLYIPDTCENLFIFEPYKGINVRIEDTILITNNGYENLTSSVYKNIYDIENYMNE